MKKIILRTRGHGKTHDCIKLCIENNALLVTPYNLKYVEEMAMRDFGQEVRAITFYDFIHLKGMKNEKIVIDEAIACLKQLTMGNELIGVSIEMEK